MAYADQLAFLLHELRLWREQGLIGEDLYQRIRAHYAAAGLAPPLPRQLELFEREDVRLELELERQARQLVAADPPPEPCLEQSLEAEARFHEELAAEVERAEILGPAAATSMTGAAAAAAADLTCPAPIAEPRGVTPVQRVVERDSFWARWLRPFLDQNALWIAGGLLVLFGSIYFLKLIWDDLSSLAVHGVIAGALHVYAGAFFGVGYALSRRRQAHGVGRILFCFAAGLLPLAGVATGELAKVLSVESAGGVALAGMVVALALALQAGMLAVMGGLYERSAIRPLLATVAPLALLTVGVAPLAGPLGPAVLLVLPLGLVLLCRGCLALVTHRVHLRSSLLFVGALLLWSFAVLVVRAQLSSPLPLTHHASLVAALAALLITCDHRLRIRGGGEARLTALGLSLYGALLVSLSISVAGLIQLGYFDLGARINVLFCSAVAVVWLGLGAARHGRSAMTYLAASAGLLTYFFLPAPFSGLLRLAQHWIHGVLGYADAPLPVAFYGLTFIPYVVGLTLLGLWIGRRGREDLRRDLQRFLLVLGALLVPLAGATRSDLRPMLWTWPIYAALGFVWARLFQRPWLRYAGHGLTMASLTVAGIWLARSGGPVLAPLLVALHGLVLAALYRRLGRDLAHAALVAAGLSLLLLWVHPPGLAVAFVVLVAQALALALVPSRPTAHLAALAALAANIVGYAAWGSTPAAAALALLGHACAAALLLHLLARRSVDDPLRRIAAGPASVTVLLASALLLGLSEGLGVAPYGMAALTALLMLHQVLVTRSATVTALAALGAGAALATLTGRAWETGWAPTLAILSVLGLLAAEQLSRSLWAAARRRSVGLVVASGLLQAVALVGALALAAQGPAFHLGWAALGAGGLALFLLAAPAVRARPGGLVGFAATSSVALALGLHHFVGQSTSGAWHLGALLAAVGLGWAAVGRRPVSRWIAAVHVVLPLLFFAAFLGVSAMLCGTDHGLLLGLVQLHLGGGAALCMALCLAAALVILRRDAPVLGGHLVTAGALGLALVLFRIVAPAAHLTLPLGLAGVVLAWLGSRETDRAGSVVWSLAVLGAALGASHGHLSPPHLMLAVACATAALLLLRRRFAGAEGLELGWAVGLVLVSQLAVIWGAVELSTGRHPAGAVLALMAPVALGVGLALDSWASHAAARVGRLAQILGGLLVVGAAAACPRPAPVFVVALGGLTLAALVVELTRRGRRAGRAWQLHGAGVALTALYLLLRLHTGLAAAGPWLDGAVILGASQLALWLGRGLAETDPLRRPVAVLALAWPLLSLPVLVQMPAGSAALLAFLVALCYAGAAHVHRSRHLGVPAMLFANLSLFTAYSLTGLSDLLLHALPLTVTLLALVHIYAAELGRQGSNVLRGLLLVALYSMGISRALVTLDPLHTLLVVPLLCVAGIVVGTLMRIRVYVLVGVGFLAADLLVNLVHYGLARPHLGALFLTLLGLALVAGMVLFSLERERILRRYSTILGQLRTWE